MVNTMAIPLSSSDFSLWLAVIALILLITSELLYSSPGYSARVGIDKSVLRIAAFGCSFCFLFTVVLRMMGLG